MKPSIYLGGPIAGLTYDAAIGWRITAAAQFESAGIIAKSPMRGKAYLHGKVLNNQGYELYPLSSQKGIVARDHFDVMTCDAILMNLLAANQLSVGSCVEFGWASAYKKPIITVLNLKDTNNPHTHTFIKELSAFIVPDLDHAVNIAMSVLLP